ncbi:MAG: TerB family tellurite resistance protein [Gilvibacter sp.]
MFRWIGAVIGYSIYKFGGAILGFIVGSFIDEMAGGKSKGPTKRVFTQKKDRVSPADFELNLLSLASLVIRSDGNVSETELNYVREYFVQSYGKERANATFRVFNDVIKNRTISAQNICSLLRSRTRYESRLQILHFLFSVANADGHVDKSEVDEIARIAGFLAVNASDFESIKAMFFNSADAAYKILEIDKTATISDIKKAYRTMAKKYHPDKLEHMDAAYRKGAEQKFRKVQEAYESLQKERDF